MEVVAQSIGSDDEEHLQLFPVTLVNPPVYRLDAICFQFIFRPVDIVDQDGGTFLAGATPGYCEAEAYTVPFERNAGQRAFGSINLNEAECLCIPARSLIYVVYRQFQFALVKRESGLKQTSVAVHAIPSSNSFTTCGANSRARSSSPVAPTLVMGWGQTR